MSAAVEADLAFLDRLDREAAEDEDRAEAIRGKAADYLTDARKLGDATNWLDHDTAAHDKARKLVGGLMLAAMQFSAGRASVASAICALAEIGGALRTDPALLGALEKMAEREVENDERNPDFNEP